MSPHSSPDPTAEDLKEDLLDLAREASYPSFDRGVDVCDALDYVLSLAREVDPKMTRQLESISDHVEQILDFSFDRALALSARFYPDVEFPFEEWFGRGQCLTPSKTHLSMICERYSFEHLPEVVPQFLNYSNRHFTPDLFDAFLSLRHRNPKYSFEDTLDLGVRLFLDHPKTQQHFLADSRTPQIILKHAHACRLTDHHEAGVRALLSLWPQESDLTPDQKKCLRGEMLVFTNLTGEHQRILRCKSDLSGYESLDWPQLQSCGSTAQLLRQNLLELAQRVMSGDELVAFERRFLMSAVSPSLLESKHPKAVL